MWMQGSCISRVRGSKASRKMYVQLRSSRFVIVGLLDFPLLGRYRTLTHGVRTQVYYAYSHNGTKRFDLEGYGQELSKKDAFDAFLDAADVIPPDSAQRVVCV